MTLKEYMQTREKKKKKLTIYDAAEYKEKHGGYTIVTTKGKYFTDTYETVEENGLNWLFSSFALDISGRQFVEVKVSLSHVVAVEKH